MKSVVLAHVVPVMLLLFGHRGFSQSVIFREDFEGSFPGSWIVADANPEGLFDAYWDIVNVTEFGTPPLRPAGQFVAYCAGVGYGGFETTPLYQDHMAAVMQITVDLRGYTSASLSFWQSIPSIEEGPDTCVVSIDDTPVYFRSTDLFPWTQETIDLTPYVGSTRTLGFWFISDESVPAEGWYIDDIVVTGNSGVTQPQLSGPAWATNTFTVNVSTQAGLSYHLEVSSTLAPDSWTTVQTLPGTGQPIQMIDSNAGPGAGFYRVRVE
jgi:hypothetical protein